MGKIGAGLPDCQPVGGTAMQGVREIRGALPTAKNPPFCANPR